MVFPPPRVWRIGGVGAVSERAYRLPLSLAGLPSVRGRWEQNPHCQMSGIIRPILRTKGVDKEIKLLPTRPNA